MFGTQVLILPALLVFLHGNGAFGEITEVARGVALVELAHQQPAARDVKPPPKPDIVVDFRADDDLVEPPPQPILVVDREMFPDTLEANLHTDDGRTIALTLKRRKDINVDNIPVMLQGDDGKTKRHESSRSVADSLAFYSDPSVSAMISARVLDMNDPDSIYLHGSFNHEGRSYEVTPADKETREQYGRIHARKAGAQNYKIHTLKEMEVGQINDVVMDSAKGQKKNRDFKLNRDLFDDIFNKYFSSGWFTSTSTTPPTTTTTQGSGTTTPAPPTTTTQAGDQVGAPAKGGWNPQQNVVWFEFDWVIDYSIYQYWQTEAGSNAIDELKFFMFHMFHGVVMAYESIDFNTYGIRIHPWLTKLVIVTSLANDQWTGKSSPTVMEHSTTLNLMTDYREQQTATDHTDHSQLLTHLHTSTSAIGVAWLNNVCTTLGTSIVTVQGYHSWLVSAHEFAHNLGTHHDGTGNSCSGSDGFIMAAVVSGLASSNYKNRFMFSDCSINNMKGHLLGTSGSGSGYPKAACVYDRPCSDKENVGTALQSLPGQIISVDEQCELALLTQGAIKSSCSSSSDICRRLRCDVGSSTCKSGTKNSALRAMAGTTCAANKVCWRGDCVAQSTVDYYSDPGPCQDMTRNYVGACDDVAGFKLSYTNGVQLTCNQVAMQDPRQCFTNSATKTNCKRSCMDFNLYYTASPLCTLAR